MNKVININFQGRILPIEEQAYEILKQYIETLRVYFANEEGRDEIINDIECRVAELCDDRLKKGEVCINTTSINLIIESIGRPADFEAQDGFEQTTSTTSDASSDSASSSSTHHANSSNTFESTTQKRLYRDEQNKVLGGVCSGIANYFGLDPLLVRVLWIFLVGINLLAYLILWIAVPSSSVKVVGGVRKRLFRDIDNKLIGGVCSGLSKYFGIRVGIARLLFLIPFIRFIINFKHLHLWQFWDSPDFPSFLDFTFSPGAVFVYIVLWLVLPEAKTSADKLEMVGEKVDLNSIKNTIQNDMEGFSKRAQSWGSEFYNKRNERKAEKTQQRAEGDAQTQNNEPQSHVNIAQNKGCLYFVGRIITIAVKVFVYFILGIVGISILAALFGMGVAGTSLLPLKGFLINDGVQTLALIGTILFFIWVPIIGIVTAVIRKIAGYKKSNKWVRTSFISLWVLGWVCLFYFFSSLGNSFSKHNIPAEQTLSLTNANVDYLEVTTSPRMKYYEEPFFNVTPFGSYNNEDTFFVRNLKIRIVQSKTDSFEVNVVKLSNGKTVQEANQLANAIDFNVSQTDSLLNLDKGIAITKANKFRNQHVILTIAVPVGKRIKVSQKNWRQVNIKVNRTSIRTETINGIRDGWYDEWNEPWDGTSYPFEVGAEYKMTTNGLELLRPAKDEPLKGDNQIKNNQDNPLKDLKEEREQLEKNNEQQNEKGKVNIGLNTHGAKEVLVKKTIHFFDLHWVLDRFTY
jgi:phage shock protein PspC (stress-responsive transcriptional regulator)